MISVIDICPICGADLEHLVLTIIPPIQKKICKRCGWSWENKPQEQIIRIPFEPTSEVEE